MLNGKLFILLFLTGAGLTFEIPARSQSTARDSFAVDQMPFLPFLPDPLIQNEAGTNVQVETVAQWQKKRGWILRQYQYWLSGSVPPPPQSFRAVILSDTVANDVELRTVELSFGPGYNAKMTAELMIPRSGRKMPVFMTQWNHRDWCQVAVRRGYIGCVYAGADVKDDTRNYSEIFTGFDFATLMKRAWGASRVIDYLYTLPEVDTNCIALTGHSRNGKQSLMAAAFDTRIKAVVSSSGGTGGESTFRYSDERFNSESLEEITRHFPKWFSPRLRLFAGREQKLPVDQNSLMSLIAPRGLMMVSAITEDQGNPWGVEQSYFSVKSVYHFLDADSKVAILLRRGRHQHAARNVEDYIDFFDFIFKRSATPPQNKLYYTYSFDRWKSSSGENINPLQFPPVSLSAHPSTFNEDTVKKQISWLLGEAPYGITPTGSLSPRLTRNASYPDDYLEEVIGGQSLPDDMKKMVVGPYHALGDDLWGNIYFPSSAVTEGVVAGKLPLVIYLHGYSYATGYHRRSLPLIHHFTANGFAVLALDMIGFGTRIEEAAKFYDRYPHWSLMGKMVTDTKAVINDAFNRMPFIDTGNIFLAGYSLGGTVALLTAALDDRVKGVAAVDAFSSLRNDNTATEGIRHYSHLHGLIPRLGFFVGSENRIPIDFDDVLAATHAPAIFISAPQNGRNHTSQSVRQLVKSASHKHDDSETEQFFTVEYSDGYHAFSDSVQNRIAEWMLKLSKKRYFHLQPTLSQ